MINCSVIDLNICDTYSSYLLNIKAPSEFDFGFAYLEATKIILSETSWTNLQEDF